ncbi:peptidase C1B, bleomycin hydrolase [Fomitiporia mediterranea MF3/22]|uniref:peptidase C1B, bleomycin hydrolase n=1 Tax=Fomitiporia mediterranea (strain MF3/22) TaxID=694068 RepID=UPI00044090B0|nr:peptidase C1B, bleomycin hydrolase [Fomitiporia mediterranea MF3/22]EJD03401.1 peptidase C1B, bleomycin hydrolase [Fomitiporia mediterranea MF3/22]
MGSSQSTVGRSRTSQVGSLDEKLSHFEVTIKSTEPISEDGSISLKNVKQWEGEAEKDLKVQLARTILVDTDFKSALASRDVRVADPHVFNLQLDFKTDPITDQKSSGRCWLFATTNVIRHSVMQKLGLKEFQLSQSYLYFWDKLNKCNFYLEQSIDTADLPLDDRVVDFLSDDLISDGGQWDMAVNLLETYGVVPQPICPESYSSSASGNMNKLLKLKLREHALVLRRLFASLRETTAQDVLLKTVRAKKEDLMAEVWSIMTALLGVPPMPNNRFTWDYYDKDGKPKTWSGTPLEFYKAFASKQYPPSESFSLINDPRNEYKKLYTVDRLGNIVGGRQVLYVNTEIGDLKSTIVKMLKAGQPVFFGCDVNQFSDSKPGIMDTALHKSALQNAFGISLNLTKAERLQMNESAMTHAMVITGAHIDPSTGKATRYKVENSWGDGRGEKGYFVMTDAWFDEFVYQIVVPKALAPSELVKVFESGEKIVLPPWDPMGSLA